MEKKWTKEQLSVISHRGGNMLVSAAAGSGKTAVLIERIMSRIMDEVCPLNLDELLVVTFTRDAAREMKERIGNAIAVRLKEEVEKNPNSAISIRLMKQSALLSEANMSTIDSFCKKIVMENFKEADIDSGIRTMDENEGVIIRKKILEEILEAEYEKKDVEFINFVEYFVRGKSDKILEELILQVHRFSESLPDKEEWFDKELTKSEEKFKNSELEAELLEYCKKLIEEFHKEAEKFVSIACSPYGPVHYADTGSEDAGLFKSCLQAKDYEELSECVKNIEFSRLSTKKVKDLDDEKKELAKAIRDGYKDGFNKLREDFFAEGIDEIEEAREVTGRALKELIRLARSFDVAYAEEKRRRNVADISDWAHFAIKVLLKKGGQPSDAAKSYSEQFAEIMIDEYQDSNLLQEKILTAIARNDNGKSNIFMVGDVKQSIYKFRQAKPELFIEKYNKYGDGENDRRIDLHQNFRSGPEVIESVNAVFERTMTEALGGIVYDEAAKLVKGNDKKTDNEENKTEVLLFDEEGEVPENFAKFSEIELEAYMVAGRIKSLREERELKYSDIAILLRTNVEWAESFRRVLISEGIPAVCESGAGYFSAWEVQVMIALLKILDNPHQDLPLGTVLLSPIGGFNEEELAKLHINSAKEVDKNADLWTRVVKSGNEKAVKFVTWLNEKRAEMIFTPVHELIKKLFTESNFYSYVQAMPSGETRGANLDMLVSKAKAYEATSLHGVVHFVRYIDRLKKYEVDFGEAGTGSADSVRIMSIHKSKGLQYPVVFVSGMSKNMNNQDARSALIIHPDIGIGTDCFNIETREKKSTILKKMLARKLKLENIAEEIRLLYVAMTRAEDKLILTARIKDSEKLLKIWETDEQDYISLSKINSLLDIAMPALVTKHKKGRLLLTIKVAKDLVKSEIDGMAKKKLVESDIRLIAKLPDSAVYKEVNDFIKGENEYIYPYQEAVALKNKMTVSELKKLYMDIEEEVNETSVYMPQDENMASEGYIPEFMRDGEEEIRGAARGTLYHSILSRLDFSKNYSEAEFSEYLSKLLFDKIITNEELRSIKVKDFKKFFETALYKRMQNAFVNGKLFRETPFVIGVDEEVGDTKEMVLVQGIIDAWFFEGEDVVLMDYKTDRVFGEEGVLELVKRYKIQIDNYAEALRRITGKEPKEKIIYSFALGKEILLEQ
ncbi:MAG: helicase-exonuclease AddAB subunit AddA [Catonella sp.]|uniref:helicase-exonuclease AddAB subunit AddA n=1 Tax=Catonella sp. TaxID=2382125 RepID=UPI003F9F9E09